DVDHGPGDDECHHEPDEHPERAHDGREDEQRTPAGSRVILARWGARSGAQGDGQSRTGRPVHAEAAGPAACPEPARRATRATDHDALTQHVSDPRQR
ncbi:hypothetical protein, partial [Intrasporangium chromatireducens]|uniref:hypothetical protein n=1 Tax=Intrasporangium chromatireducens TaxID=1386088 RepID=UPI000551E916